MAHGDQVRANGCMGGKNAPKWVVLVTPRMHLEDRSLSERLPAKPHPE